MYASAMKFCGAMELCGIGYPQNEPFDVPWPEVEAQMKAQNAGLLVAITRAHRPAEAELMLAKGCAPVYTFKNPRTGTIATLWIKDFTAEGKWQTELPPQIVTNGTHSVATNERHQDASNNDWLPAARTLARLAARPARVGWD